MNGWGHRPQLASELRRQRPNLSFLGGAEVDDQGAVSGQLSTDGSPPRSGEFRDSSMARKLKMHRKN